MTIRKLQFSIGTIFACLIIVATLAIIWEFVPALLWALVIGVSVWPAYIRLRRLFGRHDIWAALVMTIVLAIIIALPIFSILQTLIKEGQLFITFLYKIDQHGRVEPSWIHNLPNGIQISTFWDQYLAHPGGLTKLLNSSNMSFASVSQWFRHVGLSIVQWFVVLFFTLFSLFFLLKNGENVLAQINRVGNRYLLGRWRQYEASLTKAMVATVNGTVMVGLGVGVIIGIVYFIAGVPAPVLLGCLTAVSAMIPFAAPIMFIIVMVMLIAQGKLVTGIVLLIIGLIVMFVADHVVRPLIIGNATKLPFLAILFGVLGGVKVMGLLGLFLGPMVMVAFLALWREGLGNID